MLWSSFGAVSRNLYEPHTCTPNALACGLDILAPPPPPPSLSLSLFHTPLTLISQHNSLPANHKQYFLYYVCRVLIVHVILVKTMSPACGYILGLLTSLWLGNHWKPWTYVRTCTKIRVRTNLCMCVFVWRHSNLHVLVAAPTWAV